MKRLRVRELKRIRRAFKNKSTIIEYPGTQRMIVLAEMKYLDYLRTSEWKQIRKKMLECYGSECTLCTEFYRTSYKPKSLQIHHLNYFRRGYERWGDLIVLCSRCHRDAHYGYKVKTDLYVDRKGIETYLKNAATAYSVEKGE